MVNEIKSKTVKKGWIIYNGNLLAEKFTELVLWLKSSAEKQGLSVKLVKNNELLITIEDGIPKIKGKFKNVIPDFVIFWDKDIKLAYHLEKIGIRIYNSARTIEICDDKALTYEVLSGFQIAMPKTIIAPKIFENTEIQDFSSYSIIAEEIGFPMVIKESFGSFGQQVYLVENYEEMINQVKELGGTPYLFQKFISSSFGRDIRLNVVGDKVAAAMLRTSDNDFRANISAGGQMYGYNPSDEEIKLAIKCCKIIGADFAGVDILFGDNGQPVLCEVNSNAHFKNIFLCTGIDVADSIVEYIIKDIYKE